MGRLQRREKQQQRQQQQRQQQQLRRSSSSSHVRFAAASADDGAGAAAGGPSNKTRSFSASKFANCPSLCVCVLCAGNCFSGCMSYAHISPPLSPNIHLAGWPEQQRQQQWQRRQQQRRRRQQKQRQLRLSKIVGPSALLRFSPSNTVCVYRA